MTSSRILRPWEQSYWEQIFRAPIETLSWHYPALDPDLESALASRAIRSGRVLDLGAGAGTQAIALAERGFLVTAVNSGNSVVSDSGKSGG